MTETITDLTFEVTDLKQWAYCPRIPFYHYCLPRIRPITDAIRQGIAAHTDATEREQRRSLRTYGLEQGERLFDLELCSQTLGLRGRLDLLIITPSRDAANPKGLVIEYKDSEKAAGRHFKLQLAAYALLVEHVLGIPVQEGYFYHIPNRSVEKLNITAKQRQQVLNLISAMRTAIDTERIPEPPTSRAICVNCEFRRFCNDVI